MNRKKNILSICALVVSLGAIIADLTIAAPLFSALVSFIFIFFVKKKIYGVYFAIATLPLAVLSGVLITHLVLQEAYSLRDNLFTAQNKVALYESYHAKCSVDSNGYCGIGTYKIVLLVPDDYKKASLLVFVFFDKTNSICIYDKEC